MTQRTRNRWKQPVKEVNGRIYYDYGTSESTHSNRQILHSSEWESMTDIVTPSFHRKSANGDVIVNDCSHTKDRHTTIGTGGRFEYTYPAWPYSIVWECESLTRLGLHWGFSRFQPFPVVPSPTHDLQAAARLQALGNVDRSPFGFAEDLAELRETLRFLRDPLNSLRRLSEEIRRIAKRKHAAGQYLSLADAIADVWLQYRFALLPLLRSMDDLIQSFIGRDSLPVRRTAYGQSEFDSGLHSNDGISAYWSTWASRHVITEVSAGIVYEASNPFEDWRSKYGFRLKDIPETVWAVLPYSFMVDRILNVSQAVRGLVSFFDPSVTIRAAWTTTKVTTKEARSWYNYSPPGVTIKQFDSDVAEQEIVSYNRSNWDPSIGDLVPEFRLGSLIDTSTKVADLLALIWQRLR